MAERRPCLYVAGPVGQAMAAAVKAYFAVATVMWTKFNYEGLQGALLANCPSGKSDTRRAGRMSTPSHKNISLRRWVETAISIPAVPPQIRGAYRDRHERGARDSSLRPCLSGGKVMHNSGVLRAAGIQVFVIANGAKQSRPWLGPKWLGPKSGLLRRLCSSQ
jgi:hypothetical protein